jgi:hypothetical protein
MRRQPSREGSIAEPSLTVTECDASIDLYANAYLEPSLELVTELVDLTAPAPPIDIEPVDDHELVEIELERVLAPWDYDLRTVPIWPFNDECLLRISACVDRDPELLDFVHREHCKNKAGATEFMLRKREEASQMLDNFGPRVFDLYSDRIEEHIVWEFTTMQVRNRQAVIVWLDSLLEQRHTAGDVYEGPLQVDIRKAYIYLYER